MAYRIDKNQNDVPKGQTRYCFNKRYKGRRPRNTVVCRPKDLEEQYRKWQKKFIDIDELGDHRLFEIFDLYLQYVEMTKSTSAYTFESRAIGNFKKFFKDMPLRDFKRRDVDNYIMWRRMHPDRAELKSITDASINRNVAVMSSFFTYCITNEYYQRLNPCFKSKLKVNNEREVRLSLENVEELLEKADGNLYSAILLGLLCGLRASEVLSLQWGDIDLDKQMIMLSAQVTKSRKRREICVPDALKNHLQELRIKRPFTRQVIEGWQYSTLRSQWKRLMKRVNFNPLPNGLSLHFHDLRHVYAQTLRDAGVPMGDIQVFMGHSSVQTTEKRYAQFGGLDGLNKVNRLASVFPLKLKAVL